MTDIFFTPDGGRLSQDLPAILSQTASLLDQLQLAVSDGRQAGSVLRQAIPQGETALRQAREGLSSVDDALGSFLSKLENQDITAQIDTLLALGGKDPALYGAFFSQMVQTSVVKVYPIENYGSAMDQAEPGRRALQPLKIVAEAPVIVPLHRKARITQGLEMLIDQAAAIGIAVVAGAVFRDINGQGQEAIHPAADLGQTLGINLPA